MSSNTRTSLVGLLALASLAACTGAKAPPPALGRASTEKAAEVATFEGRFDPATGALTITTTPAADASGRVGRSVYQPFVDGQPGGPVNTFELKNGAAIGSGTACPGATASWGGNVTLTHFFSGVTFSSVVVELTYLAPSGREACNSDAATDGMSASLGLWDYGSGGTPMVAGVSVTKPWYFKQTNAGAFTFRGRIMATMAPLTAPTNGLTAFEWTPAMFMDPPHSFKDVGTTLSHVKWNGTNFVDSIRPGNVPVLTFTPVGSPTSVPVGLTYPPQAYATGFSGTSYFTADGSALNTTGDFTVCAKFKPGANPGAGVYKIIVAKGDPVSADPNSGWALAHFGPIFGGPEPEYSFMHRTGTEGGSVRSIFGPQSAAPDAKIFEYVCGGRNTGNIQVGVFGQFSGSVLPVTGPASNALPIVIGAAQAGAAPYADGGVYEVIFDSRGVTPAVMNEIVATAEGRQVYNGAAEQGSFFPLPEPAAFPGNSVGTSVVGADGATYLLPQGATIPISTDASGLLDAGKVVSFGGTNAGFGPVLPASPAAYCIGAEVDSASWATASGCILGWAGGGEMRIWFEGGNLAGTNGGAFQATTSATLSAGRHKVMVCYPTAANQGTLYVDGAAAGTTSADGGAAVDISATQIQVGTCLAPGPLTGARIGRVFACPSANPALCQ